MKTHAVKNSGFCPSLRSRGSAFTLIELLVVITIILILTGISLKVMSMVGNKTGVAKTDMVLEQVKNALAAYYTTYGTFPSVSIIGTEAPYSQPATLTNNPGLHRGLTAYLISGNDNDSVYPPATKSYLNAEAAKWDHYLKGIYSDTKRTNSTTQFTSVMDYTNITITINDAWGHEIHYVPQPPDYQNYTLWSDGPTGITNDDIYVTYQ